MALRCPTIVVTQRLADVPFDIRDMQALEYDRNNLNKTLGVPLQRMVVDTLSAHDVERRGAGRNDQELVGQLLSEVAELKGMVADAVRSWSPRSALTRPLNSAGVSALEGVWLNAETGSHMYARVVKGALVAPYCYCGDSHLVGVYYNWRIMGDYWFARYAWIEEPHTGFTFLRHESIDTLRGAWWGDESHIHEPSTPPNKSGVPAAWERVRGRDDFPHWASEFLKNVEKKGFLDRVVGRHDAGD